MPVTSVFETAWFEDINTMAGQIILRQETKDDFTEVFEVNRIAFGQNNEAKLVDALRNNPEVFIPGTFYCCHRE